MRFLLYLLTAILITWAIGFGLISLLGPIGVLPEFIIGVVLGFYAFELSYRHSRRW